MEIVDLVILVATLISVGLGWFRGLIREAMSIAALLIAIWAALPACTIPAKERPRKVRLHPPGPISKALAARAYAPANSSKSAMSKSPAGLPGTGSFRAFDVISQPRSFESSLATRRDVEAKDRYFDVCRNSGL